MTGHPVGFECPTIGEHDLSFSVGSVMCHATVHLSYHCRMRLAVPSAASLTVTGRWHGVAWHRWHSVAQGEKGAAGFQVGRSVGPTSLHRWSDRYTVG